MEVSIRQSHEGGREQMVGQHLRIILALFLNVDDKNLLDPEAPLDEVVPFEEAVSLSERPTFPDAVKVEPELGVIHDVLLSR